ncbi:MAG TPA: hypothetical protein VMK65_10440 [Longimicrobiales bacterium]|nr:hypothetical protein [Longimicrobiales bacterium]
MTGEWTYVWAAYLLTWGTLLLYAGYIRGRIRAAERDLVEPIDAASVYRGGDMGSDRDFGASGPAGGSQ